MFWAAIRDDVCTNLDNGAPHRPGADRPRQCLCRHRQDSQDSAAKPGKKKGAPGRLLEAEAALGRSQTTIASFRD